MCISFINKQLKQQCMLLACVFFSLYFCFEAKAQNKSVWETLAKVKIETVYDPVQKYETDFPVFSTEIKALHNTVITIKGYIIPLEEKRTQNYFILSALPYNLCYFCGGAGPETVMEVYGKDPIPYSSKPVTLKGTLKLNDKDFEHLMYILENAVLIPQK